MTKDLIVRNDYGMEAGRVAAETIFAMERRPTAVLASNDMNALGITEVARASAASASQRTFR